MKYADIHLHTYYSDGELSPKEVVNLAYKNNISIISITDHDSISGLDEAENQASKNNMEFINGIEIMASSTEILGYFIDKNNTELRNIIETNVTIKEDAILQKIDFLNNEGIKINKEDIYSLAGPKNLIMQTHLARVMVQKGYVNTIQEAFDKYLKKIRVNKKIKSVPDKKVIKTIRSAGGVPIMPHPWWIKKNLKNNFEDFIDELISYGLKGIETIGPHLKEHEKFINKVKDICNKKNLLQTGGSDFHSLSILPNNKIGEFNIDENIIKKLKNAKLI